MEYPDSQITGVWNLSGSQLTLVNSRRTFSDSGSQSVFYRFVLRNRTKIKITISYYDDSSNEQIIYTFYGIFYGNPTSNEDGGITFPINSYTKNFQLFSPFPLLTSGYIKDIVFLLVAFQKNGVRLFDRIFEGNTDNEKYLVDVDGDSTAGIGDSVVKDKDTFYDKLRDYSLIEDFCMYTDSGGHFVWKKKKPGLSSVFTFNGGGYIDNDYGCTIISINEEDATAWLWTKVVVNYGDGETSGTTSASDNWIPGDLSASDQYGERALEITIPDIGLTLSESVAANLLSKYHLPKKHWKIKTIFITWLLIGDLVTLNFQGQGFPPYESGDHPFILGYSRLGIDKITSNSGQVDVRNQSCYIISMKVDIDELFCEFVLREE
jgi:hypothetical protein